MSVSIDQITAQSQQIIDRLTHQYPKLLANIIQRPVNLRISKKLTKSIAKFNRSKYEIVLSYPYFSQKRYFDQYLELVIIHELAHLIMPPYQNNLNGRYYIHSNRWKKIVTQMQGIPEATLQLQLPEQYIQNGICSCCLQSIQLGPRQYQYWLKKQRQYCHSDDI